LAFDAGLHQRADPVEAIGDRHQRDVGGVDGSTAAEPRLDPLDEPGSMVATDEHDREVPDLLRLDQRQGLEQLVERAVAAGEDHERGGVANEHELADEEVTELQTEALSILAR
jgi:hypothetical protein